jgi:hypothetical protein
LTHSTSLPPWRRHLIESAECRLVEKLSIITTVEQSRAKHLTLVSGSRSLICSQSFLECPQGRNGASLLIVPQQHFPPTTHSVSPPSRTPGSRFSPASAGITWNQSLRIPNPARRRDL